MTTRQASSMRNLKPQTSNLVLFPSGSNPTTLWSIRMPLRAQCFACLLPCMSTAACLVARPPTGTRQKRSTAAEESAHRGPLQAAAVPPLKDRALP